MTEPRRLSRIGLVAHHDRPLAHDLAAMVIAWAESLHASVLIPTGDAEVLGRPSLGVADDELCGADVVIAIGGDGTVLRGVGLVADARVPLVALNAGQLGYLADVTPDRAEWALGELAAGRGWTEDRMRISATLTGVPDDPSTDAGRESGESTVLGPLTGLNEVVVDRAETGHTVRLRVHLDGVFFTSYVADGMVVATPTGSTAYAFSVRGPIVAPTHRALLMVPVAPHLLFDRALVMEASSVIELEVVGHRSAKVSLDGQGGFDLPPGGRVTCRTAAVPARFIRFEEHRFHDVLKRKFSLADR
ncbi:MAG: NAD(+)/NADH kinase [Microthrixaceae bacterium]|nr:NAD(+)/NADH kinase [Microthrixaceae bacterium]